eukprot:SAG22_NODE_1995_length_3187_cov_5.074482_2_plen_183_part_00
MAEVPGEPPSSDEDEEEPPLYQSRCAASARQRRPPDFATAAPSLTSRPLSPAACPPSPPSWPHLLCSASPPYPRFLIYPATSLLPYSPGVFCRSLRSTFNLVDADAGSGQPAPPASSDSRRARAAMSAASMESIPAPKTGTGYPMNPHPAVNRAPNPTKDEPFCAIRENLISGACMPRGAGR